MNQCVLVVLLDSLTIGYRKGASCSSVIERLFMLRWVVGSIPHGVSVQKKGVVVLYPVCGMVPLKVPLLLIVKSI